MNERTHFFIKIYLSHFILERVDVGYVWEVSWRRGQSAILTQQYLSTSWLGCSTVGHRGPKALCLPLALTPASCLPLTNWLKPPVPWLYHCSTFTCFRCSSAYLHRCISWLTTRSRVNMLQNEKTFVGELVVVWVLWHINFCRLFNAKSILIQIINSISNNSV